MTAMTATPPPPHRKRSFMRRNTPGYPAPSDEDNDGSNEDNDGSDDDDDSDDQCSDDAFD
jgi:hypothetical protein